MFRFMMFSTVVCFGVVIASGSSDRGSNPNRGPTSVSSLSPAIRDAQVLVGGRPVQGLVVEGTDEPTLFRVRVDAPEGLASIERLVLRYAQPGPNHPGGRGGSMMGGFRGTVLCYDVGTHGDHVAGDGIYHFMDPDEQIGCHGIDAPPGEFWCEDTHGQQSNTLSVIVTRR